MTENPERHAIYDRAMGIFGATETGPILDAYDFEAFKKIVDIGGGSGVLMGAILKRYPVLRGILFDLPPVADLARAAISNMGLSDRCDIAGGDFLSSVPAGADAYIMQHIIHDWEDDEAVTILRNCRKAMNPDGRILLAEIVIPPGNEFYFGKWLDLMMLLVGGRERTEEQYNKLFSAAGLTLKRVVRTASEICIIEGIRES
jgi:SAM-dependent methyltransferase